MADSTLSPEERDRRVNMLRVDGATFDELSLTMTHVANTSDVAISVQPLCDGGEHIEVIILYFKNNRIV